MVLGTGVEILTVKSIQYALALALPRFGSKGPGASTLSAPSTPSSPPALSAHAKGNTKSAMSSLVSDVAASLRLRRILLAKSSGQSWRTTRRRKTAASRIGWGVKKS